MSTPGDIPGMYIVVFRSSRYHKGVRLLPHPPRGTPGNSIKIQKYIALPGGCHSPTKLRRSYTPLLLRPKPQPPAPVSFFCGQSRNLSRVIAALSRKQTSQCAMLRMAVYYYCCCCSGHWPPGGALSSVLYAWHLVRKTEVRAIFQSNIYYESNPPMHKVRGNKRPRKP